MNNETQSVHLIEPRKDPINNLCELTNHLQSRQGYFLSVLAGLTEKNDVPGWEKIFRNQNGVIQKEPSQASRNFIFTGALWCAVASYALFTALEQINEDNQLHIEVKIGEVRTAFDLENPVPPTAKKKSGMRHTIVQVVSEIEKQDIFYDPTYAQIHHQYAGKIAVISPELFRSFYQIPDSEKLGFYSLSRPIAFLSNNLSLYLIGGKKNFEVLVSTLL